MADKPSSLGEELLRGPAAERLSREAGKYLRASGRRLLVQGLSKGLGGRLGGLGKKLTSPSGQKDAHDGSGFVGGVVRRLAEGKSPGRAAAGAGIRALMKKVGEKVKGFFGTRGPKMTNIVEDINIGVPVSVAYNQWTQFKEFPSYMKGVVTVDQKDEVESSWRVKVFKSSRMWDATTTEQIPDRRIAWTSKGAKGTTKGVVTFHPLADDLTKLLLVMEYYPSGFFEKTGNIWRSGGRRARLDVKHFRRFISMRGEETGSWRGEIRDGEVVRQPEEAEGREREEARVPEQARRERVEAGGPRDEQPQRKSEERPAERPEERPAEQPAVQPQRQEAETGRRR